MVGCGALLIAMCFATCDAIGEWDLIKPRAVIRAHAHDNLTILQSVGHVLTWRRLLIHFKDLTPDVTTGHRNCRSGDTESISCHTHTWETLRSFYAICSHPFDITMIDTAFLTIVEPSHRVEDHLIAAAHAEVRESCPPEINELHQRIENHAIQRRLGSNHYIGCSEVCLPSNCLRTDGDPDLPWLIRPLWDAELPAEVSFINLGCRKFEERDPLHSLFRLGASLTGLCVDVDGDAIKEARQQLLGHKVHVIEEFLTPINTQELVRQFLPSGLTDILKVDIDSYDLDVLDAALQVVTPLVIIVEVNWYIPPPFKYAYRFGGSSKLSPIETGFYGVSLSFLVNYLNSKQFFLYKLNYADSFWIHKSVAQQFETRELSLRFPIDEWACYFTAPIQPLASIPSHFVLDWLSSAHEHVALRHIWNNVSAAVQAPFTLDIAYGSVDVMAARTWQPA